MPKVFSVEGIIGAGKTTYIEKCIVPRLLSAGLKVIVVKEPIAKWEAGGIFELYNENMKRWAYTFQTIAYKDRIMENVNTYDPSVDVVIMERSPLSDRIFMKKLYEDKTVSDIEYTSYLEWADMWHMLMPYEIDAFIYLRPDLNVCMDRLKERDRKGEENITLEYQKELLDSHDSILKNPIIINGVSIVLPVYTVDVRQSHGDLRNSKEINEAMGDWFMNIYMNML